MRIKKFLALNLAIILLLNAVSFALSRLYWHLSGQTGATLSLRRAAREDKVMYYLVAGNLNQAHEAFRFLEDSLEGGITIVDYETSGATIGSTSSNKSLTTSASISISQSSLGFLWEI